MAATKKRKQVSLVDRWNSEYDGAQVLTPAQLKAKQKKSKKK